MLLALIPMLLAPVAILAAIAIPAYQGYLARSQVTSALLQAATIEAQVAQSHALLGRCPGNADAGFRSEAEYADRYIKAIAIGSDSQSDRCAIQITLGGTQPHLVGKRFWLEQPMRAGEPWACHSDVDPRYLPPSCRG
jgi:type IV pilus assembly protein PilA